ncbi:MAG: RNA methyltransferase [Deltaproteobacteria bacterium]|nr:RNA methyltransferase [Deltaproteobacteria bacterium]
MKETLGFLKNIEIVLVCPQGAGNIGSVARVMKNTGFDNLTLIDPVPYENNEGWSMACNAGEFLKSAKVVCTIEEAVKDARYICGASRRRGKLRFPTLSLDEATVEVAKLAEKNKIVVLFGREDRGLLNEEVALCDMLFEIPTHEDYPSLNLSHAVFAFCHALFTQTEVPSAGDYIDLAVKDDVKKMYIHLEQTLRGLGYGEDEKGGDYLLGVIMKNFKRLFGRTGLIEKEVNMLRGILAKIEENTK